MKQNVVVSHSNGLDAVAVLDAMRAEAKLIKERSDQHQSVTFASHDDNSIVFVKVRTVRTRTNEAKYDGFAQAESGERFYTRTTLLITHSDGKTEVKNLGIFYAGTENAIYAGNNPLPSELTMWGRKAARNHAKHMQANRFGFDEQRRKEWVELVESWGISAEDAQQKLDAAFNEAAALDDDDDFETMEFVTKS